MNVDTDDPTSSSTAGGTDAQRRPARRHLGRTSAAVVLVLLAASGWWWSHPRSLATELGGIYGAEPRPVASATTYVGLPDIGADTRGDGEIITILDHEVVFSTNTAAVDARLLMCSGGTNASALGVGFEAQIDGTCPSLRELCDPVDVRVGGTPWPPRKYLVLRVSPTRAGDVAVAVIDVTYRRSASHLFQRGTQRLNGDSDSPLLRLSTR